MSLGGGPGSQSESSGGSTTIGIHDRGPSVDGTYPEINPEIGGSEARINKVENIHEAMDNMRWIDNAIRLAAMTYGALVGWNTGGITPALVGAILGDYAGRGINAYRDHIGEKTDHLAADIADRRRSDLAEGHDAVGGADNLGGSSPCASKPVPSEGSARPRRPPRPCRCQADPSPKGSAQPPDQNQAAVTWRLPHQGRRRREPAADRGQRGQEADRGQAAQPPTKRPAWPSAPQQEQRSTAGAVDRHRRSARPPEPRRRAQEGCADPQRGAAHRHSRQQDRPRASRQSRGQEDGHGRSTAGGCARDRESRGRAAQGRRRAAGDAAVARGLPQAAAAP